MISVRMTERALILSGRVLSSYVKNPTGRPFSNRNFAESYPPQAPVMEMSEGCEWQAEQAAIDDLRGRVVEIQRGIDDLSLRDIFRVRLGFTSNKLEGNSFSELQVHEYIQTGVTIGGKTLKAHAEIESHDRALMMMLNAVKDPLSTLTTVDFVLGLHKVCMPAPREGTNDVVPGRIKIIPNMTVSNINGKPILRRFVAPEDARMELCELLLWAKENANTMPILPFVTILHYNFVRIHPFPDTNGRTVRLLISLFMLRRSYPPMIIEPDFRPDYMQALAHADHTRDLSHLCHFFSRTIQDTYKDLIRLYG